MPEDVGSERKRWEENVVGPVIRRHPEQLPRFTTLSGLPIERLYTPSEVADLDYLRDLGFPGEFPFTRGVQPTMYRGRYWTMRQYAGYGSAEETNSRFRYLLEQGQTGLSVAFDLPTQIGFDSDHALAEGEVGRVGVAIDTVADMETLFSGIPLGKVSTSMTINAPAAMLLGMYQVVGEGQGVEASRLQGTVQNDILKEYVARGTYIFPPAPSLRLVTDLIEYCSRYLPEWNSISISGYHMREAGCTAVQEVAFTLANAIAYVQAAVDRGLEVDSFARRLSFFFGCHIDFLEEIAKFRAARRLWARIMKERFGAKDPRSMMLRFHTQTAGCSLTAQQPENNVVRVALEALAAVLGGTQSLHTNSMDEALALPSEKAVRIALRTQQIIAYESGVGSTIDPLGGSYFLEALTDRIEEEAEQYLRRVDDMGGAVRAIEAGFVQKEIHEAAYRYQIEVERKERTVVGVNAFQQEEEPPSGLLEVDPAVAEEQEGKLARWRSERDSAGCREALSGIERAAAGTDNLMPAILRAVRAGCTLGEMCDALRRVFGEYRAPVEI